MLSQHFPRHAPWFPPCRKNISDTNRLVSHKIRSKVHKEETSFIPNGRVTVQGEGRKDYRTEWSLSAIELPALQYNLL